MLVCVRQQHVHAAATGDTVAPCRRLELRSGNLGTTCREVHKGDEVLAQEEAVHGPCFYCVEPIGHTAELHEGRRGRRARSAQRVFAMRELRLHTEVAIEVVGAARDIPASVLAGKAPHAHLAAGPQIGVSRENVDA